MSRWITLSLALLGLLGCSDEQNRLRDATVPRPDRAARDGGADQLATNGGGDIAADLPKPDLGLQPGLFELQTATRTLHLYWRGDGIVRLHYLEPGVSRPQRGWTMAIDGWPTAPLPARDAGDSFVIDTPAFTLRVAKRDASVRLEDHAQAALFAERGQDAVGYRRKVVAELAPDAHVYGLGEKLGPLDKRGMAFRMWNTDALDDGAYTADEDPLYQSIPYFILHRPHKPAIGIYLASSYETRFDLGKSRPDEVSFETMGGDLDYVLIYGPSIKQVVRGFTEVVGRMPLPPLWALGYHQCKWSYSPESAVRAVTSELRARQIPCDGIWLDIDYMDGFRSFTFSPSAFPDPAGLISDLAAQGFKTTVIIDPGIKHDPSGGYATYDSGIAGDHFVKDADGQLVVTPVWPGDAVFPDFTAERTRAWWGDQIKGLLDVGVRGLWIDMNEPASFDPAGFPLDSRWDGEGTSTDHRETHNVFALLMAKATREGLSKWAPGARPFVLTRAGFAGIQRHAAVWTGDTPSAWEHFAMVPATLMNMGLSGVAFVGSDVGGFSGDPGAELYARWIALGALSPFFRTHVATNNPPQEPWAFGPEVEAISRRMIELRYRRLPYLYSLMRQAALYGDPALRPLVYDFPDDEASATISDQLMLGGHLLAAPVLRAGQSTRRLYLPAGTWTDYDDGTTFFGPAWVQIAAPLQKLPLFVRENGILPAWDVQQYVGQAPHTVLYLDLYPIAGAPAGALDLYRDDGESPAHLGGAYQRLPLQLDTTSAGATLTVGAAEGTYVTSEQRIWLVFHHVGRPPSGATRDGQGLPALSSLEQLRTKDGWFYDAQAQVGHVSIAWPSAASEVELRYDATRPAPQAVDVTFALTLPDQGPSSVYLASDADAWQADAHALTMTGPTSATLHLALQAGETLEYKYTGGSWDSVEVGLGCSPRENRQLLVTDDGTHTLTVRDHVEAWSQLCP